MFNNARAAEYKEVSQSCRALLGERKKGKARVMNSWFLYAVGAAVLYGLHQIFTKMAAERISDGLGGFVVEGSAALSILIYLGWLWLSKRWNQTSSGPGVCYSVLTGICVGGWYDSVFSFCSRREGRFRRYQ